MKRLSYAGVAIAMIVGIVMAILYYSSATTLVAVCTIDQTGLNRTMETSHGEFRVHEEVIEDMVQRGELTSTIQLPTVASLTHSPAWRGPWPTIVSSVQPQGDTLIDARQACADAQVSTSSANGTLAKPQ